MDISIICITYNHEKYIRRALDSLLMQKGDIAYEILIHDDASTDKTADILNEYKERYPEKITLILQKENQWSKGVNILKTYMYPLVKGKYIAYCEGDDFWTYGRKLQKQFELMESNVNISLCYHNGLFYREENDSLQIHVHDHPSGYIEDKDIICATKGWYPTASLLGRADYIKNQTDYDAPTYDEALRTYMSCKGDLYFINRAWSVYRFYTEGSWNDQYRKDKKIAAKYIEDTVSYYTRFDSYSKGRFSQYLHLRYMEAIIRYFGVKYEYGYTVEEFESGLSEIKNTLDHTMDCLLEEFHDEYIIRATDYYNHTVINKVKNLFLNGHEIYIYGAGAEAVKAIVILMRSDMTIKGLIVTKKKSDTDTLLNYPIYPVDDIEFHENMFVWPCLIEGREEVLKTLHTKGCKQIVI